MHLDSRKTTKKVDDNILNYGLRGFIFSLLEFKQQCVKNLNQRFRLRKNLHTSSSKVIASTILLVLVFSAICDFTDACSSRIISRPKPRTTAVPTSSPRPNITFHTYKCPEAYAQWYCLNGATCFAVKIGVEVLYNCECKDGYIGPRCDYKDLDGSYLAGRNRVMLETASIAGGAVAAIFSAFVFGFLIYLKKQSKKLEFEV